MEERAQEAVTKVGSKPPHLKHRIRLSELVAILLGVSLLFTDSRWGHLFIVSGVLFALGIVLASIGTVGRLWCLLYVAGYKGTSLLTVGPYSMCRHPLYFFSLLGSLGIGLATETFSMPLIILVLFALYYPGLIRYEEAVMQARHGEAFDAYRRRTPVFFPRPSLLNEPEEYLTKPRSVRRHMLDTIWFIWLVAIVEIIKALHQAGSLPVLFRVY